MSQEPSSTHDDNSPKVISPTINLWTIQDFDRTRQQEIKTETIVTAAGIGLLILGAGLISITEGKESLQIVYSIGAIMALIGLWLGIFRWLYRLTKTPPFDARRRATGKYQVWNRVTKCAFCGQEATINIGYVEYDCLDCGRKNSIAYGIDNLNASISPEGTAERPASDMKNGVICWSCNKPNFPLERPAQFICPSCQKIVGLEKIPV
ncbi:MAG: hypothetical protein HY258_12655 [Chloroflexi bacterium]|nr:hypothetical protein [Chloroflexota bacterium]